MEKILISACLLGQIVRYDGKQLQLNVPIVKKWYSEGRLTPVCPEVAGELPVPRPPAEIIGGDGNDVLMGLCRLMNDKGLDVTEHFIRGAHAALSLCEQSAIRFALLKEHSPSCGVHQIYDGSFKNTLHGGQGVTAALLKSAGVQVFSEKEIDRLAARIEKEER